MKRLPLLQVALLPLAMLTAMDAFAEADAFLDIDASLGLDDNVTRAQENIDIEQDVFASLSGTLGTNLWRGRQGMVDGTAGVRIQKFKDFDGLSNTSLRLGVSYAFGFSSGFNAPWYALDASYTYSEFRSFLRDSDTYTLGATYGFRIDDLTSLRTALNFKLRESEGAAFDTENVSLFANIDWSITPKTTLYTTYRIQWGDTFSTASEATAFSSGPGTPWLAISSSSIPKDQPDDVFGGITYRLDSTTHIVTVGLNLKNNLQSAWDASVRVLRSDTDVGLEYEDLTIIVSYFHKFGIKF